MLRLAIIVGTGLLVGCPSSRPTPPRAVDDTALRVRVAHAEARRTAGVHELIELAASSDVHARELALRGLGRTGGAEAIDALVRALDDKDPRVVAAALAAIGVAGSLDEPDAELAERLGGKLVAALGRAAAGRAIALPALEALGRTGDAAVQVELTLRLADRDPGIAAAAALALGRHGRRKIAWSATARAGVAKATSHAGSDVRYAATYALSREHEPPADDVVIAALTARIGDEYPETRAAAIAGLAKRKAVQAAGGAARKPIEDSLRDRDWRVAAEAVRALAGANGDEAGRVAVANALTLRLGTLAKGVASEAHVISEALRTLIANPTRDEIARASVLHIVRETAQARELPPLTRGWVACLGAAAVVAGGGTSTGTGTSTSTSTSASTGTSTSTSTSTSTTAGTSGGVAVDAIVGCGNGALPDHLRLPLLSELVAAKVGDAGFRRAALRVLLAHDDPRVRAAGLTVLPATWNDGDARAQATIIGTVTSALATKNAIVAGTAVDVAGELYDTLGADQGAGAEPTRRAGADPTLRASLDTAILARARTETDVELAASLYGVIGKRTIAGGADVCRGGLSGHPARAKAAADCLKALGEATALPAAGAPPLPPAQPETVIGKQLRWHLVTTRGEVVIELRADVAPWAVASIVALTERGAYDGIEFHRVVPNFVVQGGDPTMSGWGGPGYTLPAEPAGGGDGEGYVAGGVGMADAGRDSAGSQWFIMHSRAPHLDGRYTWIGSVVAGQKWADALLIGDKVERASIEQR